MTRRRLIEHLRSQGCIEIGEGSRHHCWGGPNGGRCTLPRHSDLPYTLARRVCQLLAVDPPIEPAHRPASRSVRKET